MTSEVISTADFEIPHEEPLARARARQRLAGASVVSGLLHAAILALLIGMWQRQAPKEIPLPPIPVTLTQEEGATGASGDSTGKNASSSPTEARAAAPAPPETPPAAKQESPPAPESVVAPAPRQAMAPQEPVPPRKPTPPAPKPFETAQAPAPVQRTAPVGALPAPASAVPASVDALLREGVGGGGRGTEGAGRAAYGNGAIEGPGDDYLDLVRAWIARYKKYPDAALAKKQEGKAMLGFIVNRDGIVLDAWIEQSSGNPLLDEATLAMIHNASPIPKVPDRYKGDTLRLFMPVNYSIGLFDRLF